MHPDAADAGQDEIAPGNSKFSEWRALRKSTDKARANIIADIVGHPQGAITVEELDYMNPDLSEDSIRRHLNILQGVGVVKVREIPQGERLRDYPYKFYALTLEAREMFDKNDLFPEKAWQRQYAAVEKTPRIREVEEMPRSAAEEPGC